MSHSQFHSTDLFILRHAWLNLWDKHMTTGRINQVSYETRLRVVCVKTKLLNQALLEEVFTWDTHYCLSARCVLLPSFKLTSLKWDQKQVSRLTRTVPGTQQENITVFITSLLASKDQLWILWKVWLQHRNVYGNHYSDGTKSWL